MSQWIGRSVPKATFLYIDDSGVQTVHTQDLCRDRKVVLFGMPGAFTPVCSGRHLPGVVSQAAAFYERGIDHVCCVCMVDPFVLHAWKKQTDPRGRIWMLSDAPKGTFTEALGLGTDLSATGMGRRSQRYALVAFDGTIRSLWVEPSLRVCSISGASAVLSSLGAD